MMNPNSITTSIRPNAYLSSTGNTGSVGQQTNAPFNPGNNQALLQQLMQLIQQLVAQQNQGQGQGQDQQPPNRPTQNGHHQGQGQQPPNRPINGHPNQPPRPNTQPGKGHPYPPNISPKPNTPPGNGGGTPATTLNLSTTQQSSIKQLMGFGANAPFTVTVNDTNRDGKLSVGDEAILKGGITGGEVARKRLTAADINTINGTSGGGTGQANLQANQAKWDAFQNGNYDYTLQVRQFTTDGGRSININVRNNQVTNAVYADTGEAAPAARRISINDIFGQVQNAYNTGAAQVDVTYDPTSGAPSSVYIDHVAIIADEETGYGLSNIQKR